MSATTRRHFFLPRRFVDAFGNTVTTDYDRHDLLAVRTADPVGNTVAAWNDYRVRQALAYSIDRPTLAKALYGKRGTIGNDTPFSPAYPYTAKVPQRKQNLTLAKQLLAASGHPNGFSATLTTGNEQYKKTIAEVVQASAKKIGIDITLEL